MVLELSLTIRLYTELQLQEYLQCVVEIITDDGGQVEKLIAIDAEFAENALRRVLSRHGGIKELIARGSKGVDQALLDWRFSHGIEFGFFRIGYHGCWPQINDVFGQSKEAKPQKCCLR